MVLDILVHDGYLARSGYDLAFRSRWLKDWWSERFGNYEPPHDAPIVPAHGVLPSQPR